MSKIKKTISPEEIHKRREDALANDTPFEYECVHEGSHCVWNIYLGYVMLLDIQEAMFLARTAPETFYLVCRDTEDGDEEFSDDYDYFYNENDEQYYAVCMRGGRNYDEAH